MSAKNRLLIFAHDAASANVTLAYATLYKNDYHSILAYPKGPAKKIYKDNIPDIPTPNDLKILHTDTIVTGTSGIHSNYELEIIVQARKTVVKKIITLVDHTANFELRFTYKDKILEKEYLPDEIWIPTKGFISQVVHINSRLFFHEDIYTQYLIKRFKDSPPLIKNTYIKEYQGHYISILTEYVSELYGNEFGFNEFDFLENILSGVQESQRNIPIFLKLHPSEDPNKFNHILAKYTNVNVIKDPSFMIYELIYYSKIILGINSSVFKESKLLHKPTYSVQIGSTKSMSTMLAQENHIYTKEELLDLLWHNYC